MNWTVYSICRNNTENDLNKRCKNGSKYGPARIKQVRDTSLNINFKIDDDGEFIKYIGMNLYHCIGNSVDIQHIFLSQRITNLIPAWINLVTIQLLHSSLTYQKTREINQEKLT